jgi:hypothetical protein
MPRTAALKPEQVPADSKTQPQPLLPTTTWNGRLFDGQWLTIKGEAPAYPI